MMSSNKRILQQHQQHHLSSDEDLSPPPSPPFQPSPSPALLPPSPPSPLPPIRVGYCRRRPLPTSQQSSSSSSSSEILVSPVTGRGYRLLHSINPMPNRTKRMELYICDEYMAAGDDDTNHHGNQQQQWVRTGTRVVLKACKLKAGDIDEKAFSMPNRRPKLSKGDEPIDELKTMVYVTNHLENDAYVLGAQATEEIGLVPLVDGFLDKASSMLCTVMPHYEKKDLLEMLINADGNRLSEDLAHDVFLRVLRALTYLRMLGIAHLDLSPENIFVDGDDKAYLGDYGMALRLDASSSSSRLLQAHSFRGKPHYSAPEKIACKDFDPFLADVFSLGCTLFAMITGKTYIEGPNEVPPGADWQKGARRAALMRRDFLGLMSSEAMDPYGEVADLIAGMTEPDPAMRLSIDEVWKHPWVCGGNGGDSSSMSPQ